MTPATLERSVWGASTDEFKLQFRSYLQGLAATDDGCRAALIGRLEWCLDRWNHWRKRFYPTTEAPLLFPFIQSAEGGSEFGHYAVVGASGQPSVIHVRRDVLTGTRDIPIRKWVTADGARHQLALLAGHPQRTKFVDLLILHELIHLIHLLAG